MARLFCTLFSTVCSDFVGRTYVSEPIMGMKISGNSFDIPSVSEHVLFYTQMDPSQTELAVELVVQTGGKTVSAGWASISLGEATAMSATWLEGTPRLMRFKQVRTVERGGKVEYIVKREAESMLPIRKVIDPNCIVGPADTLPGLKDGHIPASISQQPSAVPTCTVQIPECRLVIPDDLEKSLTAQLLDMCQKGEEVAICERRLRVGCHNLWRMINSARMKNSISLVLEGSTLKCNGILLVDNVPVCPGVALVFQLEYSARITKKDGTQEQRQVVVGELVKLMVGEQDGKFEEVEVAQAMCNDERQSVTGSFVWHGYEAVPTGESPAQLFCKVSLKQGLSAATERLQQEELSRTAFAILDEKRRLAELSAEQDRELRDNQQKSEAEIAERIRKLELKEKEMRDTVLRREELQQQEAKEKDSKKEESKKGNVSATPSGKSEHEMEMKEEKVTEDRASPDLVVRPELVSTRGLEESARPMLLATKMSQPRGEIGDIEADKADPLKAHTIVMEFLRYVPLAEPVPTKLCFSCRFFSFPATRTPYVSLRSFKGDPEGADSMVLQLGREVEHWTNAFSRDEQGAKLRLQFDFDPSLSLDVPADYQVEDFLKYMSLHQLVVWAWLPESLIPIGSFKVPLSSLLRRGNPSIALYQELELTETGTNSPIGTFKLFTQNIGRSVGLSQRASPNASMSVVSAAIKTKIRSKPLTVDQLVARELAAGHKTIDEDEKRREQLVSQYLAASSDKHILGPRWVQEALQEEVEKYRTCSRKTSLMHVQEKLAGTAGKEGTMFYMLGQLQIMPVMIVSPDKGSTEYRIEILDPEDRGEVSLVTDPTEWKFMCARGGYAAPEDWGRFRAGNIFSQRENEKLVILIKILAFGPPKNPLRKINITMKRVKDESVVFSRDTAFSYKQTYINTFQMAAVSENSKVTVACDNLPDSVLQHVRSAVCSPEQNSAQVSDGKLVVTCAKAPASPQESGVMVFLFGDEFCYSTIGIVCCLLRSYSVVPMFAQAGSVVSATVELANGIIPYLAAVTPTANRLEDSETAHHVHGEHKGSERCCTHGHGKSV